MTLCFLLYNISRSVYHSCGNLHRHKQKQFRISIFPLYLVSSQGHRFQSVSREVLLISDVLRLCLTQIFNKKTCLVLSSSLLMPYSNIHCQDYLVSTRGYHIIVVLRLAQLLHQHCITTE